MPTDPCRRVPSRSARRRRLATGTALLACSACSVADNLSYDEIVTELDGIVTVAGEGGERSIQYADRAPVSAWYMRQFWLVPVRWGLGLVFGSRHESSLDNPAGHVRALLQELPDELPSDAFSGAQATLRFGWIAELDGNGSSRVAALDGLAAVVERLGLSIFAPGFEGLVAGPEPRVLADARADLHAHRPETRNGQALADADREAYRKALAALVERPLEDWRHRLLVVQDLAEILRAEGDDDLAVDTIASLRTAIGHCVREILLRAVVSRDTQFVDVRLCAMDLIRRLGGPRTVPWLLAVMSATPEQLARGEPRFDPDPRVQLRLIRYCGQLRGELAETEVKLPGREAWQALAPVDFLGQAVLTEQTYYSKLRTPAMAALTLSLGRSKFDPDPAWVREWHRERRRRT